MYDFWNQIILSNPLRKYIAVGITILLALLLKRLLSRYIAGLLFRLVRRFSAGMDRENFIKLIATPISTFIFVFVSFAALEKLHFPEIFDFDIYEISSREIFHAISIAVIIAGLIWLSMRVIDFISLLMAQKANAAGDLRDNQLILFFRDFLKAITAIFGLLMILGFAFHVEVGKLTTGLGIAGAALALAAKESVENLIASFIIFFDKPFTAGDIVKVQGFTGTIEKIGLRSTRIRTDQKTFVTVPNKQMVDSIVDNLSLRTQRKAEIRLQIGLSATAEIIHSFTGGIQRILEKDRVLNPTVFLNDISPNAFLINIDYFTTTISLDSFNELKQKVNLEILELMARLKIEMAGAATDIRVAGGADKK
jgi:MscS family membrane protein